MILTFAFRMHFNVLLFQTIFRKVFDSVTFFGLAAVFLFNGITVRIPHILQMCANSHFYSNFALIAFFRLENSLRVIRSQLHGPFNL